MTALRARRPGGAAATSWAQDVRRAALTLVAVLGSLGTVLALRAIRDVPAEVPVLAVVLSLTLSRATAGRASHRLLAVVEVPVVAVVATEVGRLILRHPSLGEPLLVVGLSVGILARRYDPTVRHAGRLLTLPFLALLTTPAAPGAGAVGSVWWPVVSALVAVGWSTAVGLVAARTAVPMTTEATTADSVPAAPKPAGRRLDAPIRMAAQMAAGLAVADVLGNVLLGDRWVWAVLSAFLVQSGNRGRGDVVHKAGQRVLGGAVGTVLATLGGGALPSGHRGTLVVLFVVMFAALVLRRRSYAFWAMGVTAMLALLHAYYGEAGTTVLAERLLGVLLGSAVGVAAAWFVLPIRTGDVLRRRLADCLAALTDDLAPAGPDGDTRGAALPVALARLDQLAPTLRAHRRAALVGRGRAAPHPVDALHALHTLAELPADPDRRARLRRDTVRTRRALADRDARPEGLPPELEVVLGTFRAAQRTSRAAPT